MIMNYVSYLVGKVLIVVFGLGLKGDILSII